MGDLYQLWSSVRWQDAVDILLNSYILFRLYALFRGTHVFRIVLGIGFLWVVQRVAGSLQLILLSWVIQGITAVAAIIIIVIFRNEIRSVLQVRNFKSIFWGLPKRQEDLPVDILAEGAFELAEARTGALIIVKGREDLSEMIQGGKPWMGLLSKDMLKTIFWHGNPVHDGAILVEGNRVVEVGCILPLSGRKDLPSYYGTRHRAAAGLAEQTDAVVIVVSEERGRVSLAKGQKLIDIGRKEDLAALLRGHLGLPGDHGHVYKRQHLEMGVAGFTAVLLTTLIWFSFARGLDTMITLPVPVEYVNRDSGMKLVDTSCTTVDLSLSGSDALIRSIRQDQVKARVDLSRALPGMNTFDIAKDNIVLPPGIVLKNVKPSTVKVSLDKLEKKSLPVQADWVGKLSPGLILTAVKVNPKTMEVIGGKKVLSGISTIYTEKISLDRLQESGTITVKPAVNPSLLEISPYSKNEITVEYEIRQRTPPEPGH